MKVSVANGDHEWMWAHWSRPLAPRYALLDSTRNPMLRDWLLGRPADSCRSLWPAPLDQALAAYSPYVVELGDGDGFWNAWFSQGIEQHWGLLVEADAGIARMAEHFQPFSHARVGTRTVLSRYYDPRVFGPLFSVFDDAQKRAFAPDWVRRIWWTESLYDGRRRLRCLRPARRRFGLSLAPFELEDLYAPTAQA